MSTANAELRRPTGVACSDFSAHSRCCTGLKLGIRRRTGKSTLTWQQLGDADAQNSENRSDDWADDKVTEHSFETIRYGECMGIRPAAPLEFTPRRNVSRRRKIRTHEDKTKRHRHQNTDHGAPATRNNARSDLVGLAGAQLPNDTPNQECAQHKSECDSRVFSDAAPNILQYQVDDLKKPADNSNAR